MLKTILWAGLMSVLVILPAAKATDKDSPYAKKALEMFRTAIAMRTAAGHGNVPKLARYLADALKAGGFPEKDIHILPIGETAALVVRYRGNGASGKKPILLSAHMDVVEAYPKDWERDPYTLAEQDGFLIGRGTADNKHGIVALTTAFLRLKAEGFVPDRDLIIGFSGDEETGMKTTKAMVTTYRALTDSEFALVADAGGGNLDDKTGAPISFHLQAAEKTYATFELTVKNPGGHSSAPRQDNAIYELATALKNIQAYAFPVRATDLTRAAFRMMAKQQTGATAKAMTQFAKDPTTPSAITTLRASPAFAGLTGTTCVATKLLAGHAENALPQSATATVNCRIFPGETVPDTLNRLKTAAGNEAITWQTLGTPVAVPESPIREDLTAAIRTAITAIYPDQGAAVNIIPAMAPYGTDGKIFRRHGIPSYGIAGVFVKPSDSLSIHGLNERIPVKAFYDHVTYWYALLPALTGR